MALRWKTRRRLALLVLVIGLPLYVLAAARLVSLFDRPPVLVELGVYLGLGVIWALPFRRVFRGIGQPEPEEDGDRGGGN